MGRSRKHEPRKVFDGLDLVLWAERGDRRPGVRLYAPHRDRLVIAHALAQMVADFGRGTRRFLASAADDLPLPYGRKPADVRVIRFAELVVRVSTEPAEPDAAGGRVSRESSTITVATDAEGALEIARRLEAADDTHGRHLAGGDDDGLCYAPDWRGIE